MPPKSVLDMPEDDKSRERQTAAAKTPPKSAKTKSAKTKSADREARLAEALRANLRRRKAGGHNSDETKDAPELEKEPKDD